MTNTRFDSVELYREYQARTAREALLPLLASLAIDIKGKRLLDIGCGTGGMTGVWGEAGAKCIGIDIAAERLAGLEGSFLAADAARLPFAAGVFDLVFAHDCLEHVKAYDSALCEIARVLADGGLAFVSFPPFYSAYGGHQQGSRSWIRFLPFGHVLPKFLWLLLGAGERYSLMFEGLSRLTIARFERAAAAAGLKVRKRLAYAVRPEVALRLGISPVSARFAADVAIMREFVVGGVYYTLAKRGGGG